MDASANFSANQAPKYIAQNSPPSLSPYPSQHHDGALELLQLQQQRYNQWREELPHHERENFTDYRAAGRVEKSEPPKINLGPDGQAEAWERWKARGKTLLSLLRSQGTPKTTREISHGYFSNTAQGYQNFKPFDVLLSHAFRRRDVPTSPQLTLRGQQSSNEKSVVMAPLRYSSDSHIHHTASSACTVTSTNTANAPRTPSTFSSLQPAVPSETILMKIANSNNTLQKLLGHEIQPFLQARPVAEEGQIETNNEFQVFLENQRSTEATQPPEILKSEDEQPYVDPRLTGILRANLSKPLKHHMAHPMPSDKVLGKRSAPDDMIEISTNPEIIKAKHQRRLTAKEAKEVAQLSTCAHVKPYHPATVQCTELDKRMPVKSAIHASSRQYFQSPESYLPPNMAFGPHSTTLKETNFGDVYAGNPYIQLRPPCAPACITKFATSAQRSEYGQEDNGSVQQTDGLVLSGTCNNNKPQAAHNSNPEPVPRNAKQKNNASFSDGHVMLVTIPTTQGAQQLSKPVGHRSKKNYPPFQTTMACHNEAGGGHNMEPTNAEEINEASLTTPLVSLENIGPETIFRLREVGVSAMAVLMANGGIFGIPIVSLEGLQRSLPAWERTFLSAEEGEVAYTSSAGITTVEVNDYNDIDAGQ